MSGEAYDSARILVAGPKSIRSESCHPATSGLILFLGSFTQAEEEAMSGALKKVLFTVLGVVIILTYWTLRGGSGTNTETKNSIPAKVWEGGGGTISVELHTTVAGKMSIGFEERAEHGKSLQTL